MDGIQEDAGDGSMQCTEHPFKNNTPAGGICALCLQEKLGKLVSSSFPIAVFPSSSSSTPSFRSDIGSSTITATVSSAPPPPPPQQASNTTTNCHHHQFYTNRSRILYLLSQKKKKKKDLNVVNDRSNKNIVFKRSKSTATGYMQAYNDEDMASPYKRGFWSFIHSQKNPNSSTSSRTVLRDISSNTLSASARSRQEREIIMVEENNHSPCQGTFDRKVSRSRSVGCGSRSFSGDFFERISTGFGDCTLRRVESQREGKSKVSAVRTSGQDCIKERVRCGGLFSGFMITSSSSSSYWVASNPKEAGKVTSAVGGTDHSRSKSWGWALASPMRAFSKPSSSKREASNKNATPNLAAIPSLLSVRS